VSAVGPDGSAPLGVALVGLGWWGSRIARTLAHSSVLRPVLGVDVSPEARAAFTEAHGVPTVAGLDEALADGRVEVVVICSPHQEHAAQVVAAAEAGRHVFVEKPFTLSLADCDRALEAVAAAGVRLGIGYEKRFEPAVEQLTARAAAGELGELMLIEANFSHDRFLALPPDSWRLSSAHAPVGPLSATGIHLVDLAISLLGRPTEVWATCSTLATSFENGDSLSVMLRFESGATAHLNAVLATPFQGRVRLFGSREWVEIADRSHPDAPSGWDVTRALPAGSPSSEFVPPFDSVRENLERFGASLRGGADYPITVDQIRLSVATSDAISRSTADGQVHSL